MKTSVQKFDNHIYWLLFSAIILLTLMASPGAAGRTSAERRNHYRPYLSKECVSTFNMLLIVIAGTALAWQRVGVNRSGSFFDRQTLEKGSLHTAVDNTCLHHDQPLPRFGNTQVAIYLTFTFDAEWKLRKDIDNLVKFVFDALVAGNIINDDMLVMEVRAKKVLGTEDSTEIRIFRQVLVVE